MAATLTASRPLSLAPPPTAQALRRALLADRERALTRLYRQAFPAVRRLVQRHGGSEADAQDVFQDALVVLYEQAVGGTLTLTAAPGTYLVSISRNLWRHEQRRRARLPHEPLPDDPAAQPAAPEPAAEPDFVVLDYVERLATKCRNILLSFYYFQQPLTQIAEAHGYRSVRSATVQKFKCLERLREVVKLRQELYGIYAERTGKTYQQIHDDSDRDHWLRADEAKEYGLIDEVLER